MRLFDEKFRDNKLKYISQAVMCGLSVMVALQFFDVVHKPVILASFGASAFIAFTLPHRRVAGPKYLIGGYFIGVLVGALIHFVTLLPMNVYIYEKLIHTFAGGIAVGLAMFLMSITNTEHPPAGGIALGFVVNDWTYHTIIQIMVGITIISMIQLILKKWMMDLIE
jgi:CBS-domain-containing membrane protein